MTDSLHVDLQVGFWQEVQLCLVENTGNLYLTSTVCMTSLTAESVTSSRPTSQAHTSILPWTIVMSGSTMSRDANSGNQHTLIDTFLWHSMNERLMWSNARIICNTINELAMTCKYFMHHSKYSCTYLHPQLLLMRQVGIYLVDWLLGTSGRNQSTICTSWSKNFLRIKKNTQLSTNSVI